MVPLVYFTAYVRNVAGKNQRPDTIVDTDLSTLRPAHVADV